MAIEIQTKSVKNSDAAATLTFNAAVQQFVIGVTGYNMSYPDGKGHDVQTFALSLSTDQTAPNQIKVTVNAQLSDNGGNQIDTTAAWVTYAVIALTGTDPGNITLANVNNVASGTSSGPIALAGSPPQINVGALSGFDLSYGSGTDHDVQTVSAGASAQASGYTDVIQAQALMKDGGSNSASTAAVNGGVIATFAANAGLVTMACTGQQTTDTVRVDMSSVIPANYKLGSAAAILTGYQISYGGTKGNDINSIGAGLIASGGADGVLAVAGLPSVEGSVVSLPGPRSFMYDLGWPSNHSQDDSVSSVDFLVVGSLVQL